MTASAKPTLELSSTDLADMTSAVDALNSLADDQGIIVQRAEVETTEGIDFTVERIDGDYTVKVSP